MVTYRSVNSVPSIHRPASGHRPHTLAKLILPHYLYHKPLYPTHRCESLSRNHALHAALPRKTRHGTCLAPRSTRPSARGLSVHPIALLSIPRGRTKRPEDHGVQPAGLESGRQKTLIDMHRELFSFFWNGWSMCLQVSPVSCFFKVY